jgi:hypothetical protein
MIDTSIIIIVAGLALCILYHLSLSNPHGWSVFPNIAVNTPSKATALVVAFLVGLAIFLMEYFL